MEHKLLSILLPLLTVYPSHFGQYKEGMPLLQTIALLLILIELALNYTPINLQVVTKKVQRNNSDIFMEVHM